MPEGDTIYKAATALGKALGGRVLTRLETSVPEVQRVAGRYPPEGRAICAVESRGKNLLITLAARDASEPRLVLHTHMRMTGSWHIYRPDETWRKPDRLAKVVLYTEAFVAPCFNAPVVELLTQRQAERNESLKGLGPDAITEEFDEQEAFTRLRRRPDLPIGVGLMNQRAMSGVGNVFKSEVLFSRRVSPFALIRELDDDTLMGLVQESHRLLTLNRGGGPGRITRSGLDPREGRWVYGRSGEACRVCGGRILMRRQGLDARSTYYCPQCQPAPLSTSPEAC